jgi:hypothetical protein
MTDPHSAIRALVDRYAFAIDGRDPDGFAQLFAAEGVLRVLPEPGRRHSPVEFHGRTGVAQLCRMVVGTCDQTVHFVGNHVAEVDGNEATAQTYCIAHHLQRHEHASLDDVMVIRYVDWLVVEQGEWRFAERIAHRLWSYATPAASRPVHIDFALAAARELA